jgi:hypothetical protein
MPSGQQERDGVLIGRRDCAILPQESANLAPMSNNPYAPPSAPVDDVVALQASMTRPRQIVLAVQLAVLGYVLGLVVLLLSWSYYTSIQSATMLIVSQALSLVVFVWLYAKIYAGRNWARITLLVFTLLGFLGLLSETTVKLIMAGPAVAKVQMVVGLGLNLTILWLLFLSPGREWFRKSGAPGPA